MRRAFVKRRACFGVESYDVLVPDRVGGGNKVGIGGADVQRTIVPENRQLHQIFVGKSARLSV